MMPSSLPQLTLPPAALQQNHHLEAESSI